MGKKHVEVQAYFESIIEQDTVQILPQAKPRSILISKSIDPAQDDPAKPKNDLADPKPENVQAEVVQTLKERMSAAAMVKIKVYLNRLFKKILF